MIYAFRCDKCGHDFEEQMPVADLERFKNKELKIACPKCKSKCVKNVICGVPAHYRGSGWTKQAIHDVSKQSNKEPINVSRDKSS